MITAVVQGENDEHLVVLGITRENVRRLLEGKPIRVGAGSHPGFPVGVTVVIVFGEDERELTKTLQPMMSEETKIIVVPQEKDRPKGVS